MFLKLFPVFTIGFWGVIAVPLPSWANPITPLTRAEIQNLRNVVQLVPRIRVNKRPARKTDAILPGDGLSTGRASLADLRFNDGSLARVGEQAVFQFLPKTRNFTLSNGTVLLLIPQGRGQTRIQTPSAAAAIRGSALFVRYDQSTDTTIVGALTNSGIEVFNKNSSQNQVVQAGQLMVIVKGQFRGLYDFDLKTFYETSSLVEGLNLTNKNSTSTPDPTIASVQAEIAAALTAQSSITGAGVIDNPSFLQLTTNSANSSSEEIGNSPTSIKDNLPIDLFVETGQVLLDTSRQTQPVKPPTDPIKPPDPDPIKPPTDPVKPPDPDPIKPPTDPIKPPDPEPDIIYDEFGNPIPR
jgi:FecR protein